MNKIISFLLLLVLNTTVAFAQGSVKGRVLDKKSNTGLEFINVVIRKEGSDKILKGAITDTEGHFIISDVPNGNYTLTASGMGYKDVVRTFSLTATSPNKNFIALYLSEDAKSLDEVVVTAQRADMKLEVDRKTFSVDQQISNAGGVATDVLENIPSVEVDNEGNVSLRGNSSVEVWIDGLLYQTNFNVAKSTSTGLELTARNRLFRILNLSTSANFYYYKLDGFSFDIDGQTITGQGNSNFTWNARMQASLMLPYDMSVQLTGNYNSRQSLAQGYRSPSGSVDFGFRKSFFNKLLVLSVNCRDLLDTRKWNVSSI